MRVAVIAPYSTGPMRGNITTVKRIAHYLGLSGIQTIVLPVDSLNAAAMERRLVAFEPHIIHGFHAYHCGETARRFAERLHLPLVLTIAGSDLYDSAMRRHPDTGHALAAASAICCFAANIANEVERYFPETARRLFVVPQGVEPLPPATAGDLVFPENAIVLLLPAALRPVKNVDFAIEALSPLLLELPELRLVIAGGTIDQVYAGRIRAMLPGAPYATWLGEVPYERMGGLYSRANVVLNCSSFEEMPNSLLEAMALGRPVLASDIPGNRSLVENGRTGMLYRDETGFRQGVRRLVTEPALAATLGRSAEEEVLRSFSPWLEAKRYIRIYEGLSQTA